MEQIQLFSEGIAASNVLAIDDADHWIFVSHEHEVLNAIDVFIEELQWVLIGYEEPNNKSKEQLAEAYIKGIIEFQSTANE